MNLSNNKQILNSVIIAIIPVILMMIAERHIPSDLYLNNKYVFNLIIYLISAIIIYLINTHLYKLKIFRDYKKYEGKWVEFIPDYSGEISICELTFTKDGYVYEGKNYRNGFENPLPFSSKEFVCHKKNEFYYVIESSTYSVDGYNPDEGFGKVVFDSNNTDGFYKGHGYFIDLWPKAEEIKTTKMIKFDKNFWMNNLNLTNSMNPNKFTDREIYEQMQNYIKNRLEQEHALND